MRVKVTATYETRTWRTPEGVEITAQVPFEVKVEVTLDPMDAMLLGEHRPEVNKQFSHNQWTLQGNVLRVLWRPAGKVLRENSVLETCGNQTRLWVLELRRDLRAAENPR